MEVEKLTHTFFSNPDGIRLNEQVERLARE